MTKRTELALIGLWAVMAFLQNSVAQGIRTVMVTGKEISTRSDNGSLLTLTSDGVQKSLPTWSKNGTKIAFVEKTDKAIALASLVVMDATGNELSEIPIKPSAPGEVRSGMRYVETLEWLTTRRIAVSGTVNPSTTEYDIFELVGGALVKQFFDDGYGATFSQDGQHYAYVNGSPHFTPVDERVPTLNVDDEPVFRETGNHLEFTGAPEWSQDSSAVAIAMRNLQTGKRGILIWHEGETRASFIELPTSISVSPSISWNGGTLYLTNQSPDAAFGEKRLPSSTWVLTLNSSGVGSWTTIPSKTVPDELLSAEALRHDLEIKARVDGGRDADFWCNSCELNLLPRRSGGND
jgi:hypothetical protein